jgi:hypothetical protein
MTARIIHKHETPRADSIIETPVAATEAIETSLITLLDD